jgi:hypothetical protein
VGAALMLFRRLFKRRRRFVIQHGAQGALNAHRWH